MIYLCLWVGTSGGIQVLYEHVRLLRRAGVQAVLGAPGPFRRCDWFANDPADSPGISDCLSALTGDDIVVAPEICVGAPELDGLPARRVAFVQNPSLLHDSLHGYAGAIVPTRVIEPWLRRRSGHVGDVAVVPGFLHAQFVGAPRTFTRGRPRILIVDRPDKHRGEPAEVQAMLRERGDIEVTVVDRSLPRIEFTALFARHDVYLHLSHPEGFPISILEAFGAGCLVVGFAGCGGLEFMRNGDNCFVVPDGSRRGIVETLHLALGAPAAALDTMLRRALVTARSYREDHTAEALARAFPTRAGELRR